MNIFVGCSSRNEIPNQFLSLAEQVGDLLKSENIIIGGLKVGMMGNVVKNIPSNQILQIILKDYVEEGMIFQNNYYICNTSFERLHEIWNHTEIFLILPGGMGTLGELLTFLEENRMNLKKKKLILFNDQHYYDDFIFFIEKLKKLNFVNDDILEGLLVVSNLQGLSEYLERIQNEIF